MCIMRYINNKQPFQIRWGFAIFIGKLQCARGPTQHLIHTPEDFEGYTITQGFYDPDYYFCAYKHIIFN